jgi:ankyrin repeat protein
MFSKQWRSLLDFAVINDKYFSQKYILLNNYDVDYGIRGIGSAELRIGDMELNNVFHFLARIEGYYSDSFYNYISEDDIKTLMNISNGERLNPLMILFKIGNFDNVGKVSFFLTYTDFNHLDYNDNNLLHYYAMNENIFVEFKENVSKENITLELFNLKNEDGLTPYELALEMGNVEKAKHIKDLQDYYK